MNRSRQLRSENDHKNSKQYSTLSRQEESKFNIIMHLFAENLLEKPKRVMNLASS